MTSSSFRRPIQKFGSTQQSLNWQIHKVVFILTCYIFDAIIFGSIKFYFYISSQNNFSDMFVYFSHVPFPNEAFCSIIHCFSSITHIISPQMSNFNSWGRTILLFQQYRCIVTVYMANELTGQGVSFWASPDNMPQLLSRTDENLGRYSSCFSSNQAQLEVYS